MKLKALPYFLVLTAAIVVAQTPQTPAKPSAAPATSQSQTAPIQMTTPGSPQPAAKVVNPDDVVLWIGGEGFTRAKFETMMRTAAQVQQGAAQMSKQQFAMNFGMLIGLTRTAEKEKIDQTPQFKDQVEFMRMQMLAQTAFQQMSQKNQVVTDEQVKAYFDAHKNDFQQATLRGILVAFSPSKGKDGKEPKGRTEEETLALAKSIREKIVAGADFAEVAKENSDEPETGPKGGNFGTIRRGQLPPNIEKAVFTLKPKEISQPVAEATGYYIFRLEDLRESTLEEATPGIRQQLIQQATAGTLDRVKSEYPVKLNDDYFQEVKAAPDPLVPKKP